MMRGDQAKARKVLRLLSSEYYQLLYQSVVGLDVGVPGEYRLSGYLKLLSVLFSSERDEDKDEARDSVFLDIGFGLGKAAFVAALCFPGRVKKAIGIEIVPELPRLATEFAYKNEIQDVEFLHMDGSVKLPKTATHVYIFSLDMNSGLIQGIANQSNKIKWRRLISSHKPTAWHAAGLVFDLKVNSPSPAVTGLSMAGSGRQYCMYLIQR